MTKFDDAMLVLKGWTGRKLRLSVQTSGVRELHAFCFLMGVTDTAASFVLAEDFALDLDLQNCSTEYAQPPIGTKDNEGIESILIFRGTNFLAVVMLLEDSC